MISLIIPVYNEEESIRPFLQAVKQAVQGLGHDFEFIFINDGSTDDTFEELRKANAEDPRVKAINFSRNFGKETALSAGFRYASGDAVIPMDVDMQDPPELIGPFIEKWEEGYDVVMGVRAERASDTAFKRFTAKCFYAFFNLLAKGNGLVPNAGDYRLLSRAAVDALNLLPERVRFMKGLYAWVGFKQTAISYTRPARAFGKTKWSFLKLWRFALDGITGFTTLPLRIWSYVGLLCAMFGFAYAVFLIIRTLLFGADTPGYASLMVALLFMGGLVLTSLGIIGEYLGRVYEEVKMRPLYLISEAVGFESEEQALSGEKPPKAAARAGKSRARKHDDASA